jgi:hydrogenase nickel incorporation protein HypA/HybF
MHELSICGSIATIVTRRAQGRKVDTVHVRIGQLRQIVPDTLVYCWSLVSAETELDGSQLQIENIRTRIKCHDCGASNELGDYPILICESCDSANVEVLAGEEFLVTFVELVAV